MKTTYVQAKPAPIAVTPQNRQASRAGMLRYVRQKRADRRRFELEQKRGAGRAS